MKKEEYKRLRGQLCDEHEEKLRRLEKKYALSNSPYKIGDEIVDHYKRIRIYRIFWSRPVTPVDYPHCVYEGTKLKKNGEPYKDQRDRYIHQINVE